MLTLALLGAVSLYTPFLEAQYWQRWFVMPNVLFAAQVPLLTAIIAVLLLRSLAKRGAGGAVLPCAWAVPARHGGAGVSMWPWVVPQAVTIWQAAAPERSQSFMLVGVAITLPLILGYTGWSYWVFRGKVGSEGYH